MIDQRIEYFFIDVKEICNFNSILFDYSPNETGVTVRGTLTLEDYHIGEPKLALKIVDTYTRRLYENISPDEVKDNLIRHQQDLSNIFIRSTEGNVIGRLYDLSHCREVVDLTRKEVKQYAIVEKDWCPKRFWHYCQNYYTGWLNFMRLQNMKYTHYEIDVCMICAAHIDIRQEFLINKVLYRVVDKSNIEKRTMPVYYNK